MLVAQGKTPEFRQKMGEIHELFVLPLSLVWFAGATPIFDVYCQSRLSKLGPKEAKTLLRLLVWGGGAGSGLATRNSDESINPHF